MSKSIKQHFYPILIVFLALSFFHYSPLFASFFEKKADPNPAQLLEQMDLVLRGHSHEMLINLDVKTKRWQRTYIIKVSMKGVDYAFARVLAPPKSEGQGFLRIKTRLWQYLPSAERTILIPPSLMLDNFLGSDFSNDDFVKLSYFPRDYESKIISKEKMDGMDTYHLELLPKPNAPVTYGKLEIWLRKSDSAPVQWKFFNEKMIHIRTLHYSDFKMFDQKDIPTVWRMENMREKDRQTTVIIKDVKYEIPIEDSFFSRKNLEISR